MKVNDIVIVGGGSAGWMSAAALIRAYPEKNITVIESPNVPTIGVGESTYDGIQHYVNYLGVDISDFFAHTNASIKLGVQFRDFYDNTGDNDYLYLFGNSCTKGNRYGLKDWYIRKHLDKNILNTDFCESYFPAAWLAKHKTFNPNLNKELDNFSPRGGTALHFDAIKFANWLKNRYSLPRGVKLVSSDVVDIQVGDNGIEYLTITDGTKIYADLFVDCTGFKSLLLEQAMGSRFISYTDILPNNRAVATQMDYIDKDNELDCVTTCTAIQNGWVWKTPLWSRIGTGYVYSDQYCSPEEALRDFKQYLHTRTNRSYDLLDSLKFNDIKIKSGIHENTWVKNVVAIGLSAAFIEPLESTGLFTVHDFLFQLIASLSRGVVNQWDIDVYNNTTQNEFDNLVEFIQLHYALSIRKDTKYWEDNLKRSYDLNNYEKSNADYSSHIFNLKNAKSENKNPSTLGAMAWISVGMNYFVFDKFDFDMEQSKTLLDYEKVFSNSFKSMDDRKKRWEEVAINSPSMNEYLRDTFYREGY